MGAPAVLLTSPTGRSPEEDSSSIEARITERVRSFDMPALLDLLASCGYTAADIEYRSHRTLVSHGHLVHEIAFERSPRRRVVITVNLGLLSAQSPLPSFLFQAMDNTAHDALEDFLSYFDHHLLRARFMGHSPERDEALTGSREVAEDRLRLLRLASPSSLHWLCTRVFPEAEVKVVRTTQWQPIPTPGLRMGVATLGAGSAVGGFAVIPRSGLEVCLCFDEPLTGDGTPWAIEARRRLDSHLLPWLTDAELSLRIVLVLRGHFSHASLREDSHLAYDPLVGGPERDHRVVLFSRESRQSSRNPPQRR